MNGKREQNVTRVDSGQMGKGKNGKRRRINVKIWLKKTNFYCENVDRKAEKMTEKKNNKEMKRD